MPTAPLPPQPETEAEARLRTYQIIGSDLGAPAAYNGDWHQALKNTAARWAAEGPARTGPAPATS
ncbi:hypothetical protein [Streptomyces sasae]|uniref:hypothetical protein n=1 Tax=Streptomyces sasae TaxID=1266772 RepID=UPI00292D3D1A|nr:hypothetical protein [Streptomyces sasae]